MPPFRRTTAILSTFLFSTLILSCGPTAYAQPKPAASPVAAPAAPPSEDELISTREQVLALLRMSPTLTDVVEADPAILSDQDYVTRANPQLAQYLTQHPEVVRNPTYYLFSNIPGSHRNVDSLHKRNGNYDYNRPLTDVDVRRDFLRNLLPLLAFIGFLVAFVWIVRILLESRRWTRIFRLQSEVHSKLIDRFATNQELLNYMETEPGKRFLEAAPIPVAFDSSQSLSGGLSRVLGPLQLGIVLTLLGIGLLILQHNLPEMADGLLVFGMLALMPGLGFIISALITWRISTRLGLMQPPVAATTESPDQQ